MPRRAVVALFFAASAIVLAGCSTRAPVVQAPSGPPSRPTLASEQKQLSALFEGTPVVFAMQPDGSLRVSVPRRYCFDRGEVKVKRPLAAVLDRLARSQAGAASKFHVAAPPDAESRSASLARERALSTRDYLSGHGIAATRQQAVGVLHSDAIEIVITDPPAL